MDLLVMEKQALKCRRKFLRHFPGGFADETYLDWSAVTNGKRIKFAPRHSSCLT